MCQQREGEIKGGKMGEDWGKMKGGIGEILNGVF